MFRRALLSSVLMGLVAVTVGCAKDEEPARVAKPPEELKFPEPGGTIVTPGPDADPQDGPPEPPELGTLDPDKVDAPPTDGGPALVSATPGKTAGKETKLIPREVLFGNPTKARARISPDGRHLAYLAPVNNVLNVFVGPADDPDAAKAITDDKNRGIRNFFWAYTSEHILYTQDKDGDENNHVYSVNVKTAETKNLTPLDGVRARIEGVSQDFPGELLVGLNDRVPQLHDLYRVNIQTGERKLIQENPGMIGFMSDDQFEVRFAFRYTPDGSLQILKPGEEKGWDEFMKIGSLDAMNTGPRGFDKTGQKLYFLESRDRNTSALTVIDLETGKQETIAASPKADFGGMLTHPTEKTVQAVYFTYARREWKILDDSIAGDLEYLKTVEDGEVEVTSRTLDDRLWTVAYIGDDGPIKFYLYDRENRKADYLFSSRDDLDDYDLAKMHPVVIKSRDGLNLVSYLTLPVESDTDGDARPEKPLPMVLSVHGGPWSRDGWGYDPSHQWLANRGYAVLSVNFRGSTGFGKDFTNAANREWSGKMHDDLLDAVDWAVKEKIAQKDNVAIMGGSYGGYATLVGLTFTPEVFRCGVDIVGPSSLVTLLQNAPPYWAPFMPVMKERVGDHTTEEGRKELLARSPLTKVDEIVRPLLIGQGKHDPRVTQVESDQIVEAMQKRKIPVTYVLYPDEGHGFARPQNRKSFNAVVEAFLSEHLGGRFQPVGGDFDRSSITVPAGAGGVPGLAEALSAVKEDGE